MPSHYTFSHELWIQGRPKVHMIKTALTNICTETICRPLTDTPYFGINGGFYESNDYNNTPIRSDAICVDIDEVNVDIIVNGKTFRKNYNYNGTSTSPVIRKTMVLYTLPGSGLLQAVYRFVGSKYDIQTEFPTYRQVIGGIDYTLDSWGSIAYNLPTQRTVLAWSAPYAYLIVTDNLIPMTIPELKSAVEQLGLNPSNSIVLDGSGSSAMKCAEYEKKGESRHIFNMIRLINAY